MPPKNPAAPRSDSLESAASLGPGGHSGSTHCSICGQPYGGARHVCPPGLEAPTEGGWAAGVAQIAARLAGAGRGRGAAGVAPAAIPRPAGAAVQEQAELRRSVDEQGRRLADLQQVLQQVLERLPAAVPAPAGGAPPLSSDQGARRQLVHASKILSDPALTRGRGR